MATELTRAANEPIEPDADFFISYTISDVAWATWVGAELERIGYRVTLQKWDAPTGGNFVTWIDRQIDRSRWIIALFSPHYLASQWCIQEYSAALARGKLIPLRLVDFDMPATLRTIGWQDLFSVDEDSARQRLLRAVGCTLVPRVPLAGFPGQPPGSHQNAPFPGYSRAWNVPARLGSFTGRDRLLEAMRALFSSAENGRVAVVQAAALHGLGGVGKSQLAIEYAHQCANEYDIVWWIDAEQTALIGEQFAQLGRRLGIEPSARLDDDVTTVREILRRTEHWLLIFDNAPDAASLLEWLPSGQGHVLLTSRSPSWGQTAAALPIDVFERSESIALLRRRITTIATETAKQLAEELGDLPLAIEQAAAYLEQTGMNPEMYLDSFRRQRQTMLAKGYDLAYDGSVDTCWNLAVQRLDQEAAAASMLLDVCCQLAPEPIPLAFFYQNYDLLHIPGDVLEDRNADPIGALDDLVADLRRYSLVGRTGDSITIHRLVAAVVRAHRSGARRTALQMLATVIAKTPEDPMNWSLWTPLVPHLSAAPALDPATADEAGDLSRLVLFTTARYLIAHGDLAVASSLDRTLLVACRSLGEDHPHALAAANNVAAGLHMAGQYQDARAMNAPTLERMRRVLGPQHPDSLACGNNLAADLRALGDVQLAFELDTQVLAMKRQVLGPDHPHTLTSAFNLAADLRAMARYSEARDLLSDILSSRIRLLGENDTHTLIATRSLAANLRSLGMEEAADALEEDSIERRRSALGIRHVHRLVSGSNLARDLHAFSEHRASRLLDEDALDRSRRKYGDDHLQTLVSAGNLARVLFSVGELEAARRVDRETLDRSRRVLGDDHPHTVTIASNLALDLHALGHHDAAREWDEFARSRVESDVASA